MKSKYEFKLNMQKKMVRDRQEGNMMLILRTFVIGWIRRHLSKKTNKNKQAFQGEESKYPQVETELLQYIGKTKADCFAVSVEMLLLEAREIANKLNISSNEFKASYGWIRRFMKRHDLAIRRQTSMVQ